MELALALSLEPLLQYQYPVLPGQRLRPTSTCRYTSWSGHKPSNSTYMQPINPNYGGNGTNFFVAPSYVQGANFPAISPAPLPGIQRNGLNSPGYNDVDLSLSKAFGMPRIPGLGEKAQL